MRTPPDYIEAIARARSAGALDWDDARLLQDAIYDPCENHPDRPGKGMVEDHRWCCSCFVELYPAWNKAHQSGVPV